MAAMLEGMADVSGEISLAGKVSRAKKGPEVTTGKSNLGRTDSTTHHAQLTDLLLARDLMVTETHPQP